MKWIDRSDLRIPYYTFENIENTHAAVCAFTTRHYRKNGEWNDFFQPVLRPDSDLCEVAACNAMLAEQFGTDTGHLISSAQKHTANIYQVTKADLESADRRRRPDGVDGMITNLPGIMLQTFGADCPSVYLVDPVCKAIGLCHSGRKGTQYGIAGYALAALADAYGTDPKDVEAAISPGICADCYEVGDDVAKDFEQDISRILPDPADRNRIISKKNGRFHLDLNQAVFLTLRKKGVPEEQIQVSDLCTRCRSDRFYSFRGQGCITNENCAVLMLKT